MKKCKFCGKEFKPNSNRQQYCQGPHTRICPVCGKEYIEDNVENLKRPPVACSYECRVKRTQETSMKTYGCKAPGNNPEAREKARKTCREHLGVDYAMQSPEVQEKSKATLMARLGVDNAAKSLDVQKKRLATSHIRYGEVLPFNTRECYEKQWEAMMNNHGVMYGVLTDNCIAACGCTISKTNLSWQHKLDIAGISSSLETKIERYSYDIQLTGQKTLIEINPTYTHNSYRSHWSEYGLPEDYHIRKSQLALKHGYRCIHVWDWDDPMKIIQECIPRVDVPVDQFEVYRLTPQATNEFLDKYDFQGGCRGQLLCIGLVKDGEIYQVMTFGKSKYDSDHHVQLMRMCTKAGYEIVGGYDTLSKWATDYGLYDIVAYSDISKGFNTTLEQLGMKRIRITQPREIWSKGKKYITDSLLQQHGAARLLQVESDESNDKIMIDNGWLPVMDCGREVFSFK